MEWGKAALKGFDETINVFDMTAEQFNKMGALEIDVLQDFYIQINIIDSTDLIFNAKILVVQF